MTIYYVSKTGNNGDALSLETAKTTINAGCGLLSAGDTLLVNDGTYDEALNDVFPEGDATHITTIRSINPLGAIIAPTETAADVPYRVIHCSYVSKYVVFDGLVIDGAGLNHETIKIATNATRIIFQNCLIRNAASMGILIAAGASYITVQDNEFDTIGTSDQLDHGVYISSTANNTVRRNLIHDVQSHAVHIYGSTGMDNNVVESNTMYNCKRAVGIYGGNNNKFYNNVAWEMSEYGILLRNDNGDLANTCIYNNTLMNGSTTNIGIYNLSGTGANIKNNIVTSFTAAIDNTAAGTVASNLTGVSEASVAVLNLSGHDYHLTASSPAKDQGADLGSPYNVDKDGNSRPQGSVWDIGAYEFLEATLRLAYRMS